jgi:WD40 repeat protein
MVAISPVNGAGAVPSDAPIQITFDRPMNEASVASHFHLVPSVRGRITWPTARRLVFRHVPFQPAHKYEVVLSGGYRDASGNANPFRHSWKFKTEVAPILTGSSPQDGATGVDPATSIALDFSRGVNPRTLEAALTISPPLTYTLQQTPGDPAQILILPQGLLAANTRYAIAVDREATDVDGNHLGAGAFVSFQTGPAAALNGWITFTSTSGNGSQLWMVDHDGLPRELLPVPLQSYTWSPDGTRLLARGIDGTWFVLPLDGTATPLPISGQWAQFLAPQQGYVELDGDQLEVLKGTTTTEVADGVTAAAVSPTGLQVAFAIPSGTGWEVSAYDVQVHAQYRLFTVSSQVEQLAWSPDGQWLAYLLAGTSDRAQLRATSLRDGTTVTVATGRVSDPAWQADSRHLFYLGTTSTPQGLITKIYRAAVQPTQLPSSASGIPAGGLSVQTFSPSPDGRQLAFVAATRTSPGAVWVMNADGTGLADLAGSAFSAQASQIAWNPG